MKKFLNINIIVFCILGIAVTVCASNKIQAYLADYNIYYYKQGNINNSLSYPLISYDEHAYISVRDVSEMLNTEIKWNEETNEVILKQCKDSEYVIKNNETAAAIAKAIAEQDYKELVNEDSVYYSTYARPTSSRAKLYYEVFVIFDPPKTDIDVPFILSNADIRFEIDPTDGTFIIKEDKINSQK